MRRFGLTRFVLLPVVALAALALPGCGTQDLLTAPGAQDDGSQLASTAAPVSMGDGGWSLIASTKVTPGHAPFTLAGSRYSITFGKNALDHATTISMFERDPNRVDVRLEPDGATFSNSVVLTIDYAGTTNDPENPLYVGMAPRVSRFSSSTGKWVMLAGTDNSSAKTYSVVLTGFSRYAMGDGMEVPTGTQNPSKTQRRSQAETN